MELPCRFFCNIVQKFKIRLQSSKIRRLPPGIVERLYDTKRHLSCMIYLTEDTDVYKEF